MNTAGTYGTSIERAAPNGSGRAVVAAYVGHVPDSRNAMRHNVYINVIDADGRDLRGDARIRIEWGWDGQGPGEESPALALDKPPDEWGTNIPLFRGQRVWCRVDGLGIPSDRVRGLRTDHPQEGTGNFPGHHSFEVVFRLVRAAPPPPPPVVPVEGGPSARLRVLAATLRQGAAALEEVADFQDGVSGGAQG